METKRVVIGVCGGTGSGKTTLAQRIHDAIHEHSVMVSMDWYYKNNTHLPFEERVKTNYDHPDSFDVDLLVNDLKALKEGRSICHPTYDYEKHLRGDEWVDMESAEVIIIEGILLFAIPEVVELLDMKVFVDTDADVRILRRVLRDCNERGRSLEGVVRQYLTTVKPMHEKYIEPSKKIADVIIPEGGKNDIAYSMLVDTLLKKK